MPVIDLWADGSAFPVAECDICIIGSGPAGSSIARELSGVGVRVVVLESGGFERRAESDALNEIENVGRPRADQWAVRNRIVGGSSHTWGGRSAPFDEIDFEKRSWVPDSGWPFGLDELEPYLDRSALHLGLVYGNDYNGERFWQLAGRKAPQDVPDPARLLQFFWQHSRDENESYPYEYTRFGRNPERRLGPDVTLVAGATVLRIKTVDSGRAVSSVAFARPDGSLQSLSAPIVVLCGGGIENARLLLSSDDLSPNGLGNAHDLVGRYLMDHLRGPVGHFDVAGTQALQKRFGRYNVENRFFRAGVRLSPAIQEAENLLNAAAWLGETFAEDDPWNDIRRILSGRPRASDIVTLASNAGLFLGSVKDYFIEGNGIRRKLSELNLLCMVEQRPDPDSRVTLSDKRDRFGMRLSRIDWRSHEDESRTMRRTGELVAEQFRLLGFPVPTLAEWVRDGADMPLDFRDVAHPTGTTRMSDDPAKGVVDIDSQVHGIDGLYVTGSSVFPTAGHCNPTQMIVALALRLADTLKERVAAARPVAVATSAAPDAGPAKVLVTGATGRIGRILVEDLLDRGYRVRATTSKTPPEDDRGGRLEWKRFDFLEDTDYDGLVAGCDAVLHLAAELGKMARMQRVNVEATRRLGEAAEKAGVRAFCYASSVAVYGSGLTRRMSEDAPVLTAERDVPSEYWALDYVRAYGRTKLAGEYALREIAKTVRYVILRPTVVVDIGQIIGLRDWGRVKRTLAAHRHAHHVYVRDVTHAFIWAMERAFASAGAPGSVETFNLSEDEYPEPTHADFMRKAFAASGDSRFRVFRAPGIGDWLHDFLRFRTLPLRNPLWRMQFPNDRLREAGYRHRFGMAAADAQALAALRDESRKHSQKEAGR
ncbi:MAG: NAD-dependent epimerase/dehydratase family protein [Pseudochelatococcus sp.]|jgi:choline dehydrogenase-like flavoprotein/nucleoside-diphosphate-sugar epimerase|uniref:NAD-dependent epimerase/dehydratase family protein n=1 Tax=Pseudochelatococcus sp. TaxID=2020869 RepID=UPI003D9381A4